MRINVIGLNQYVISLPTMVGDDYYEQKRTSSIIRVEDDEYDVKLYPYIVDGHLTKDNIKNNWEWEILTKLILDGGLQDIINNEKSPKYDDDEYIIIMGDECEQYEFDIRTIKNDCQLWDSCPDLRYWVENHIPPEVWVEEYCETEDMKKSIVNNILGEMSEENDEGVSLKTLLKRQLKGD